MIEPRGATLRAVKVMDAPRIRKSSIGTENSGPRCRHCKQTEARCAYLGGCCSTCGHWRGWKDGNPPVQGAHGGRPRQACEDCRRIRRACEHGDAA